MNSLRNIQLQLALFACLAGDTALGMDHQSPNAKLQDALRYWNNKMATEAIAEGADVNCILGFGYTPLLSAVVKRYPCPDIVKTLIEAGANVNARVLYGWPALMHAAYKFCEDDKNEEMQKLRKEVIELLIAAHADVDARDDKGKTPLMNAICEQMGVGSFERIQRYQYVVERFLQAGSDVNAQDNEGYTPLMHAMHTGVFIKSLISAGADVHIKNKLGESALSRANNYAELRALLLQAIAETGDQALDNFNA